jgi:hypothetical protein
MKIPKNACHAFNEFHSAKGLKSVAIITQLMQRAVRFRHAGNQKKIACPFPGKRCS